MDYCNSYTNLTIQSRKARETLAFVTISHWGTIASIQARFTQTLVELYFTKRSYKEKKAKIRCVSKPKYCMAWPIPKVLMHYAPESFKIWNWATFKSKMYQNSKFWVSKITKNDIFGPLELAKIWFHVKSEWR